MANILDAAGQFVKLEAENDRLRKELAEAKTSAEQVGTANKLAEEAWQKSEDLAKELEEVKAELEEAKKLKEQEKTAADKTARQSSHSLVSSNYILVAWYFLSWRFRSMLTNFVECSSCRRCACRPR